MTFAVSSWDFYDVCVLECIIKLVLGFHALLNFNSSSVFILLDVTMKASILAEIYPPPLYFKAAI
jgi:hypothetical protein